MKPLQRPSQRLRDIRAESPPLHVWPTCVRLRGHVPALPPPARVQSSLPLLLALTGAAGGLYYAKENGLLDGLTGVPSPQKVRVRVTSSLPPAYLVVVVVGGGGLAVPGSINCSRASRPCFTQLACSGCLLCSCPRGRSLGRPRNPQNHQQLDPLRKNVSICHLPSARMDAHTVTYLARMAANALWVQRLCGCNWMCRPRASSRTTTLCARPSPTCWRATRVRQACSAPAPPAHGRPCASRAAALPAAADL